MINLLSSWGRVISLTIIDLEDVSFVSHGHTVIDHLNLKVEQGDFLAICGSEGSGKSALLKIISTLLEPTSGIVSITDDTAVRMGITAYRQQVAFCFQKPILFGRTVRDNLTFPFTLRHTTLDLGLVEQYFRAALLPATTMDRLICELSMGEKQLIVLIRNLLLLPKVLLLDEITADVDEQEKTQLHRLIQQAHQQGMMVIMATLDRGILPLATRHLKLANGKLESKVQTEDELTNIIRL